VIDRVRPHGRDHRHNVHDGSKGPRDARLTDFELALELDELAMGGVKPSGEDCSDIKRGYRIVRKQSLCVSAIKLRTFESSHVSGMGLVPGQ
jgi:hypothetical protein